MLYCSMTMHLNLPDMVRNYNPSSSYILFDDIVSVPYLDLAVLHTDDIWYGNPRDMSDEDIEFFGLDDQ